MKATAVPAVEHTASSPALHAGKQGNMAFFGPAAGNEVPFFAPRIQTKLTIGRPGDKYEQEADAMADRVVQRLANPGAPVAVQKKCQDCEEKEKLQRKEEEGERETPEVMRQREEEEAPPVQAKEKEEEEKPGIMRQVGPEEEEPLQAKAEAGASTTPSLESRLSSAKGAGVPMDKSARVPMESAFGQDFGRVRIHTDSSSAQMNRELNARAFTHGREIYFNAGEYSPGSTEGRRLLAHELVHVGQQGKSILQKKVQLRPFSQPKIVSQVYPKSKKFKRRDGNFPFTIRVTNLPCACNKLKWEQFIGDGFTLYGPIIHGGKREEKTYFAHDTIPKPLLGSPLKKYGQLMQDWNPGLKKGPNSVNESKKEYPVSCGKNSYSFQDAHGFGVRFGNVFNGLLLKGIKWDTIIQHKLWCAKKNNLVFVTTFHLRGFNSQGQKDKRKIIRVEH
jgi:hypothetical protein